MGVEATMEFERASVFELWSTARSMLPSAVANGHLDSPLALCDADRMISAVRCDAAERSWRPPKAPTLREFGQICVEHRLSSALLAMDRFAHVVRVVHPSLMESESLGGSDVVMFVATEGRVGIHHHDGLLVVAEVKPAREIESPDLLREAWFRTQEAARAAVLAELPSGATAEILQIVEECESIRATRSIREKAGVDLLTARRWVLALQPYQPLWCADELSSPPLSFVAGPL